LQVVEDKAKINLQNVAGLPPAKCYSEYIESRKKAILYEGALKSAPFAFCTGSSSRYLRG
jgi:hypothetical protein